MRKTEFLKLQPGTLLEHAKYGLVVHLYSKGTQTIYFKPASQWATLRYAENNPDWPITCFGDYTDFQDASELAKALYFKGKEWPPLKDGTYARIHLPAVLDEILIAAYENNFRMYKHVWEARGTFGREPASNNLMPHGLLWYDGTLQFAPENDERILHRLWPEWFFGAVKNTPGR